MLPPMTALFGLGFRNMQFQVNTVRGGVQRCVERTEVRQCLLYHSVQNLLSSVCYPKYEDQDILNCNFACCFVWV